MRKSLQCIFCIAIICLTTISVSAQNETSARMLLPKSISQAQAAKKSNPTLNVASCGPDTLLYSYIKEVAFSTPNDSFFIDAMIGPVRTASQGYALNTNANILGVQFWGGSYTMGTTDTMTVTAYLYSVDTAYMPLTALDSATVMVTEATDWYKAIFSTPYAMNDSFAVAVRPTYLDTLTVVTNNAGNVWGPNYAEKLAWRRFGSGSWNKSATFFGQDLEYMIWPIVSYSVTSGFTASADTLCANDTVTFTNTSSAILANRMFNLYAFDAYWFAGTDSSYAWNYGDNANWTYVMDTTHAFAAPGTYSVSLIAQSLGYYSYCADTMTMNIYVPSVDTSTTFMNDTIWSNATGATYQWMECNGDTMVPGATLNYYAPTIDGDYAVIVTKDGCSDTSFCVNFSTVGIKDVVNTRVNIYPNPARENITIVSGNEIAQQIIVTNALGEVVNAVRPSSLTTTVDLSSLNNSIYFVKIMFSNSYKVVKVIKQ